MHLPALACEQSNIILINSETYCKDPSTEASSTLQSPNPSNASFSKEMTRYTLKKEGTVVGTVKVSNDPLDYSQYVDIPGQFELTSIRTAHSTENSQDIGFADYQYKGKNSANQERYRINLNQTKSTVYEIAALYNFNLIRFYSPITLRVQDYHYEGELMSYRKVSSISSENYHRFIYHGFLKRESDEDYRLKIYWEIATQTICLKEIASNAWISDDTENCDRIESLSQDLDTEAATFIQFLRQNGVSIE